MERTVEEYIAKGYEPKMAEYFAGEKRRPVEVVPKEDFSILVTFDNGDRRLYDVRPLLRKGTVFEPFMDREAFRRVYIDDTRSICWDIDPAVDSREVWNNKVDISADCCYVYGLPV
ncbi:MAG: DUF2442 domain-containing protein [Eubacteriales bacterium]|nr:DUF2442 domain-containing protein [Eubacteriales bacterium]